MRRIEQEEMSELPAWFDWAFIGYVALVVFYMGLVAHGVFGYADQANLS